MKIEVYATFDSVKDLKGKIAIVIDVLRATSVITTALSNGAERVSRWLRWRRPLPWQRD